MQAWHRSFPRIIIIHRNKTDTHALTVPVQRFLHPDPTFLTLDLPLQSSTTLADPPWRQSTFIQTNRVDTYIRPPSHAHTHTHNMAQSWDYIAKIVSLGNSACGKSSVCQVPHLSCTTVG